MLATRITQMIKIYINKEPGIPSKNDFVKFQGNQKNLFSEKF